MVFKWPNPEQVGNVPASCLSTAQGLLQSGLANRTDAGTDVGKSK